MAKVKSEAPAETSNENAAATTGDAAAKPAKEPKSTIRYVFKKDPGEGQKFAPQALCIVKHIKAAGADGISRDDLCKALSADETFKTKQPVVRIVSYYQKDLINAGIFAQAK